MPDVELDSLRGVRIFGREVRKNPNPPFGYGPGSDGEKRGALIISTTRARQFCTRCNLKKSCSAMLINELQ